MNLNGDKNNAWRSRAQYSRSGEPGDSPQARRIIFTAMVVVALAFGFLAAKLWHMQILTGEHYRKLSENNRIRLVDMPPNRGLIFDSKGRLLADNRPAFTLEVVPEDVADWEQLTKRLGQLVGITPEEIKKARRQARGQPPFKPVRLRANLDRHQLAVLETFRYELAGVRVKVEYRRAYHAPYTTAHLIGYLGEINKKELHKASRAVYRIGDFVGRSGLEKSREQVLHGRRGARQVEVDVMGRELAVLKRAEPQPGHNLRLTIDLKLQEAAAKALGDEAGGVVAMNPNNGQVLCLYSSPSFDQNLFMTGMTPEQWKTLSKNEKKPLKNRAVSGLYPPGSTYKVITAAAGLAEGVVTPQTSFFCGGQIPFGRRTYRCWAYKKGGHGHTDLKKALRESCDVYFYKVGLKLGVDRLAKYAKAFGLGVLSGVPLPHESGGLVPTSKWKKKRYGVRWQDGETLSVAIGQSFNLTTPMQLCRMVSVIANGGRLVTPTLVKEVAPADGSAPVPEPTPLSLKVPVKPEHLKLIHEGLVAVINEPGGTARRVKLPGITVAGKTGTAQVVSLKLEKSFGKEENIPWKYRAHGLFVCYAPAEKPEIAVAAVVEHGLHGGSAAGPVAKAVLKAYFNITDPKKDPGKKDGAGAVAPPSGPPAPVRHTPEQTLRRDTPARPNSITEGSAT